MLWKKHNGFINHQNKLTFVAPGNGTQTRISLLSQKDFVKSATRGYVLRGLSSFHPNGSSLCRHFRKTVVLVQRFYMNFILL